MVRNLKRTKTAYGMNQPVIGYRGSPSTLFHTEPTRKSARPRSRQDMKGLELIVPVRFYKKEENQESAHPLSYQ